MALKAGVALPIVSASAPGAPVETLAGHRQWRFLLARRVDGGRVWLHPADQPGPARSPLVLAALAVTEGAPARAARRYRVEAVAPQNDRARTDPARTLHAEMTGRARRERAC